MKRTTSCAYGDARETSQSEVRLAQAAQHSVSATSASNQLIRTLTSSAAVLNLNEVPAHRSHLHNLTGSLPELSLCILAIPRTVNEAQYSASPQSDDQSAHHGIVSMSLTSTPIRLDGSPTQPMLSLLIFLMKGGSTVPPLRLPISSCHLKIESLLSVSSPGSSTHSRRTAVRKAKTMCDYRVRLPTCDRLLLTTHSVAAVIPQPLILARCCIETLHID